AAESRIRRRHQGEANRCIGWTKESRCHCGAQCLRAAAVETGGMVAPQLVELELAMSPAVSSVPKSKTVVRIASFDSRYSDACERDFVFDVSRQSGSRLKRKRSRDSRASLI